MTITAPPDAVPSQVRKRLWRRLILAAVLIVGLTVVVLSDAVHAGLLWVLDVVGPVIASRPVVGAVVFVVLAALSAMLAFFSSVFIVPVALDAWGMTLTAFLLWGGWTLGGMGAYALGRYFGYQVAVRLTSPDLLERYRRQISAHASFGIVLLFQLALSSEVPGYVLGLARYPIQRFVVALAIVEIPYAVLTVYISAGLVERRLVVLLGAAATVLLMGGVAFLAFRKRLSA